MCLQVAKPNIGENHPAQVRADVTVNLNLRHEIKAEWEGSKILYSFTALHFIFDKYIVFDYS